MKKYKIILLSLVFVLALALSGFAFSACGEKSPSGNNGGSSVHVHRFSSQWSADDQNHWHAATCGHTDIKDKAAHTYVNGVCTTCNHAHENHSYGNWVEDIPASETAKGSRHKDCFCGNRVTEETPKIVAFEFRQSGNGYAVTAYTGSLTELTVPSEHAGKPVTIIDENAFYNGAFTSIKLPTSLKEIGRSAFGYCTQLKNIEIPNCVRIGDSAFEGCAVLQEITLPEDAVSLGRLLFNYCTELKKITIGGGAVSPSVFSGCENVQEIVLGNNVTSIAQNTFQPCKNLQSLTIPRIETNDTFMHYYFGLAPITYQVTKTETIITELPDDIVPSEVQRYSYGNYVFGLPKNGTSWYYNYSTINVDGKIYTYSGKPITVLKWKSCYETTVGVYYSVPEQWRGEFYCDPESSLKTLNISDQIIKKTDKVFGDCSCTINILKKASIVTMEVYSGNPSEFYPDTFYEQFRLHIIREDDTEETIYLTKDDLSAEVQAQLLEEGEHTFTVTKDGQSLSVTVKIVFHAFEGAKLESKKFDYDGEPKSLEVEGAPEGTEIVYTGNGQTEPGSYPVTATLKKQFYKTATLEATMFITSDSLLIIENGEILGATPAAQSLTYLYLGSSDETVTAIANYAFEGFTNLQAVTIAPSILSIGVSAFSGCKNLQSVLFEGESALQTIGNSAFSECSKLAGIEIPDSVTSIDSSAFYNCTCLKSVNFGNNSKLETIGSHAFSGCTSLESITIPDSLTTIGGGMFDGAFSGCTSLERVNFGNNSKLKTIGGYAFNGCTSLESIDIPDSVTSIGGDAFYGCSSLESVTIGSGVTSIGGYAFYECANLGRVTFGNESQLKTIGNSAFYGCSLLTSIVIPASVTSIGGSAFSGCSSLAEATFADPNNWSAGGTPLVSESLAKTNVAATYLTRTYRNSEWKREK